MIYSKHFFTETLLVDSATELDNPFNARLVSLVWKQELARTRLPTTLFLFALTNFQARLSPNRSENSTQAYFS